MTRYFSTKQVAERFNYAIFTLKKWRKQGKGPKPTLLNGGRTIRYSEADIDKWLAEAKLTVAHLAKNDVTQPQEVR